jgi:hypothetical protein
MTKLKKALYQTSNYQIFSFPHITDPVDDLGEYIEKHFAVMKEKDWDNVIIAGRIIALQNALTLISGTLNVLLSMVKASLQMWLSEEDQDGEVILGYPCDITYSQKPLKLE